MRCLWKFSLLLLAASITQLMLYVYLWDDPYRDIPASPESRRLHTKALADAQRSDWEQANEFRFK